MDRPAGDEVTPYPKGAAIRIEGEVFVSPSYSIMRRETEKAMVRRVVEKIAQAIEAECVDLDWPNDEVSRNGARAAAIAREVGNSL